MPFSLRQTDSSLWIPTILCGLVGFLTATALWLLRFHVPVEMWLDAQLVSFFGQSALEQKIPKPWAFGVGGFLACLVSLTMLDTPGKLRRSLVWMSSLILILGLAPLGYLFGWTFDVLFVICSVFVTGLCSLYWTAHHRMPCERIVKPKRISDKQKDDLLKTKRISLKALRDENSAQKPKTQKVDG